jgi:DNA invertase Pin-like site-specific DNA recombinase
MRVAIYTRVSTGKQDTENQARQLRDFATKQGWTITQEFTDSRVGDEGRAAASAVQADVRVSIQA